MKFTGKERDAETGLHYFGARYFSAAQGRFTRPDEFTGGPVDAFTGWQVAQPGPLPDADIRNPQSFNKYVLVLNNSLRYTDPDGHCSAGQHDEKVTEAAHLHLDSKTPGVFMQKGMTAEAKGVYSVVNRKKERRVSIHLRHSAT